LRNFFTICFRSVSSSFPSALSAAFPSSVVAAVRLARATRCARRQVVPPDGRNEVISPFQAKRKLDFLDQPASAALGRDAV
jgi:hypothetical protein